MTGHDEVFAALGATERVLRLDVAATYCGIALDLDLLVRDQVLGDRQPSQGRFDLCDDLANPVVGLADVDSDSIFGEDLTQSLPRPMVEQPAVGDREIDDLLSILNVLQCVRHGDIFASPPRSTRSCSQSPRGTLCLASC